MSATSTYFGGYQTDGGGKVSAVITVPDIPCGNVETGVFTALGVRDFDSYTAYSGVFAVCHAGETSYSAALYAPGIERHLSAPVHPGDRVRVEYVTSNADGDVSIENLTRGWDRHEDRFLPPDPFFVELGDYSVTLDDARLTIPEFGRHKFTHARVDGKSVDDDISTKVTLMDAAGRVSIDAFVAVDGKFTLWTEDPDLAPHFPVSVLDPGASDGVTTNATVANIDDDAELEICGTGTILVPAVCWNADGSVVLGWHPGGLSDHGAEYVSVGSFEPVLPVAILLTSNVGVTAFDGHRDSLDGWPQNPYPYATDVPVTVASTVDGNAMVVVGVGDGVAAMDATGQSLPGWPVQATDGGSNFQTAAVADVDGDPGVEIFSVESGASLSRLYGYHEDGSLMAGYPLLFDSQAFTYPAIGDIDGDSTIELVVTGREEDYPYHSKLWVFDAATGHLVGSHVLASSGANGVVALANLDQTCGPGEPLHMIVQSGETLEAVAWNGATFEDRPGFPIEWGEDHWVSNSAPAVGDLNGDGSPDIAITGQVAGASDDGAVFAFDADGDLLRRFPKDLPLGGGGGPAIADIDLDGRNELVIKGSKSGDGWTPSLWVYDLGGGPSRPPEWSQFMNTSDHRSTYEPPTCD